MPDVAWNQTLYQLSNPDGWLYDINGIKGWATIQIIDNYTINSHLPT